MPKNLEIKKIKAFFFDLDGTLLDTAPEFSYVLNRLRANYGLKALPFASIRAVVSNGARALAQLGFPEKVGSPEFDKIHQALLDTYAEFLGLETQLFDGMDALLLELEHLGIKWGIVTNKPARFTEPLLIKLNLFKRCASIICPDHVTHRKPHPEGLLLACQQIDCHPSEAIYVGDHPRDIQAGKNANMLTIAAMYGYIENFSDMKSAQADFYVDSPLEIQEIMTAKEKHAV